MSEIEEALRFIRDIAEEELQHAQVGTGAEVALRHIARRAGEVLSSFPAKKLDDSSPQTTASTRPVVLLVKVNGQAALIQTADRAPHTISYEDVIAQCRPPYPPGVFPSVTFTKGPVQNPQGSLSPGQRVPALTGMQFTAVVTGSA